MTDSWMAYRDMMRALDFYLDRPSKTRGREVLAAVNEDLCGLSLLQMRDIKVYLYKHVTDDEARVGFMEALSGVGFDAAWETGLKALNSDRSRREVIDGTQ